MKNVEMLVHLVVHLVVTQVVILVTVHDQLVRYNSDQKEKSD